MFGNKKKIAELENALRISKEEKNSVATKLDSDIESLKSNRSCMDEILNTIVDTTRENENIGSGINNAFNEYASINNAGDGAVEYENAVREILRKAGRETDSIKSSIGTVNPPMEEIAKTSETIGTTVQNLSEKIDGLKTCAHDMAALSLNAAVEAARLKDKGRDFLNTAEEIRKTAEFYETGLAETAGDLDMLVKKLKQLEMFTQSIKDGLSQTEEDAEKVKSTLENVPILSDFTDIREDEDKVAAAGKITDFIDDLNFNVKNIFKYMEDLGKCFENMQNIENELTDSKNKLGE